MVKHESQPVVALRQRSPRGAGDRLREEIIAVATELIDDTGDTDELTLRGVAARIGISAPSIYRHFTDLDDLKMAVVRGCFAEFGRLRDAASPAGSDPARALLDRCRSYCQFALAHPGPYRFMFGHRVPRPGDGDALAGSETYRSLASSIRSCQEAGRADSAGDPEAGAAQVWAALHGLVMLRMNVPEFPWPESLEQMADLVVIRLVGITDGPAGDLGPPGTTRPKVHGENMRGQSVHSE